MNVDKGEFANTKDLEKAFGTRNEMDIAKKILEVTFLLIFNEPLFITNLRQNKYGCQNKNWNSLIDNINDQ